MMLNHSKTIRSVISLLWHFRYGILSMIRIKHLLLFYCDLISWTTPTCFSTFYRCAMVPTLVENSKLFVYLYIYIYML